MNSNKHDKIFLDANVYTPWGSIEFKFSQLVFIGLLVVGSCFYLVFKSAASSRDPVDIVLFIVILLTAAVTFAAIRRYWTFKVFTAAGGLTLVGLMKKRHIHWEEITAIEPFKPTAFGNIAPTRIGTIRTHSDIYYFPLAMIEKGERYPQMKGQEWSDANRDKKDMTLQNCPLYKEIQKHLTQGST